MTKQEEFKIYLIRHFFDQKNAMLLVKLCPQLLEKYSFEELALISTYMGGELTPKTKSYKISPLLHQCAMVASMRDPNSSTYIEYLINLFVGNKYGSEVIGAELLHRASLISKKIKSTDSN